MAFRVRMVAGPMSIKNLLRKAANLVVEMPEQEPEPMSMGMPDLTPPPPKPKTIEQIVRESPGPNLDEIKVDPPANPGVTAPGGKVEFSDIYTRAGLPPSPFSAEQALDVMNSLPAELPLEVRRKTVQATLAAMGKAMGVNTESVVADASRKLAAIAAYGEALEHQVRQFVSASESKISDLERQIEVEKGSIADVESKLAEALGTCEKESDRLDDVLEFFTLDIAPSKHAP